MFLCLSTKLQSGQHMSVTMVRTALEDVGDVTQFLRVHELTYELLTPEFAPRALFLLVNHVFKSDLSATNDMSNRCLL